MTFINIAKRCGDQLMACFVRRRFSSDGSKPDGSKPDRSKPDRSKLDRSKPDRSKPDRSKPDRSKLDVEVILLRMSIQWVAEVFAAYTVTSSSECEGSCPRA